MTPAPTQPRYRAYPAYKPSGVEWLGDIPEGWETAPLGKHFSERRQKVSDKDFPALSVTMQGIVPQLETAAKTDDSDNRKLVRKGDFVINSRSDRKGSSGLSQLDGSVSLISTVMTPKKFSPAYVHHLFRSYPFQEEFYRFGKGIVADLWSTNFNSMKGITIPVVSIPEQTQIAAFLDHETAKIDTLIARQQRLIALLEEKRQAVISHAVTKGLNPDAPLRPSGIDWLGDIPAHWQVKSLKHIGTVTDCKHITAEFVDEGYPLASIAEVKGWVVDLKNAKKTTDKFYTSLIEGNRTPITDDIIYSRNATVGAAAIVQNETPDFAMGQDVCLIRLFPEVLPMLVLHTLKSKVVEQQLELAMIGSTFKRINVEDIRNFSFAIPPIDEQGMILDELEKISSKFAALIAKADAAAVLLQERRTALISAAVTGKIDVRGWSVPASVANGHSAA